MDSAPVCHICPATLTWDTAVFFNLLRHVVLSGPDRPIATVRGPHVCVCPDCATLVLRHDVQGIITRSAVDWVDGQVRAEAAALVLRFLDAVGPPLDFEDWLAARHG